ncbi:BTB/POZ domain-containing protein KCTD6-like [Saccostrea cucullata]|uniref:BTB/POZ domain-containing protein KCTD6-like n=1 Tax=Saccostrea cuccullata TaxID=36930 RepID=UPI002ED2C1C1
MEESEIIRLNVGGHIYTTTRSTLVRYPDSMLGAMFKGDIPSKVDQDGNFFIDRDGQMFRYILNFCRSGKLCLPQQFSDYDLLENEADFYQIEPLITSITSSRQNAMKESQEFNYIEIVEENLHSLYSGSLLDAFTTLDGRTTDLTAIPGISTYGKSPEILSSFYSRLTLSIRGLRLEIGEFLSKQGWIKEHSNLSFSKSSSRGDFVEKKIYREVWKICRKNH